MGSTRISAEFGMAESAGSLSSAALVRRRQRPSSARFTTMPWMRASQLDRALGFKALHDATEVFLLARAAQADLLQAAEELQTQGSLDGTARAIARPKGNSVVAQRRG
jgi:hypothetical protein